MTTLVTLLVLSICGASPCAAMTKPMKCASGSKSETSSNETDRCKPLIVVALGDSTTAPRAGVKVFASLLEQQLKIRKRTIQIINAGVPGDTTTRARARFEREVLACDPDVVTIQFGINDSAVDVFEGATQPRVSLQNYEQNLYSMVDSLQSRGVHVVLLTPNPVAWTDELKALYNKLPYRTTEPDGWNTLLKDYAGTVHHVARTRHVPLVDIYQMFQQYGAGPERNLNDLMVDGMHPNSTGHSMIAEKLAAVLPTFLVSECKK